VYDVLVKIHTDQQSSKVKKIHIYSH